MKDYMGKEISVGDTVVAAVKHGRNSGASLQKFVVTGFTEKFVKGVIPTYTGYTAWNGEESRIDPKKVLVINK